MLSDPKKRQLYDQYGFAGVDPTYAAQNGGGPGGFGGFGGLRNPCFIIFTLLDPPVDTNWVFSCTLPSQTH